jgi:large subunit ribosomal protein L24e
LISLVDHSFSRTRRTVKVQRAIVGASLEELKKKRQATKPQNVATESALKEVRSRQKTATATTGGSKHYSTGPKSAASIPRNQRGNANARGGAKR